MAFVPNLVNRERGRRGREKVYSAQYNNTAVETEQRRKMEGCQKGTRPIIAGHPAGNAIVYRETHLYSMSDMTV